MDFFAALRIALLNCTALRFTFSLDSCSPLHFSSANCLKPSQSALLQFQLGALLKVLTGVFWSTYGDRSMVASLQLRADFKVAKLVNVVSCKWQIGRACGSPASGVESGRVPWIIDQYQLLVGGPTFHFFSIAV